MGARGSYGFLKYKNYATIKNPRRLCDHGYQYLHKGDNNCNPAVLDEGETKSLRVGLAVVWFLWLPFTLIYMFITQWW
jgi:hypothetical protein